MDGDEQRRRQYEQHQDYSRGYVPPLGTQTGGATNPQQARLLSQGDGSDRFRQAQPLATRPPTSDPSAPIAGGPQGLGAFVYVQGQQYATAQMQGTSFSYPPDYLQQSQQPQRQHYSQYQSQMIYASPQQAQAQSPYEQVGAYQPRQTQAAAEVLSSQFNVPQHYYGAQAATVSNTPATQQSFSASPYQQLQYSPQSTLGQSTLASPYTIAAPNSAQDGAAHSTSMTGQALSDQLYNFTRAIAEANEHTASGRLVEAADTLMRTTDWLLNRVADLGLTRDRSQLEGSERAAFRSQRLELWDNFNNCWLALLQRQKDDTQHAIDSGHSPASLPNLLPLETLNKLGDKIVGHGDNIERTGLIDYQMGVAEEEIIRILIECTDLIQPNQGSTGPLASA